MRRVLPLTLLLLLLCAACAKPADGRKTPLPAPAQLADEILASGAFADTLTAAESRIGCYLYGMEETAATETLFYLSSGATAEELAIFRCADEAAAKAVKQAAQVRLDYQAETFADYAPAEVPKLEKALVRVYGNTVLVCVAADYQAAAAVLDQYA